MEQDTQSLKMQFVGNYNSQVNQDVQSDSIQYTDGQKHKSWLQKTKDLVTLNKD